MMGLEALSGWAIATALSAAVLHFLWQGALIGALAGVALLGMRRGSAQSRYIVGCAALAASFVVFAATFMVALEAELSRGSAGAETEAVALFPGGPRELWISAFDSLGIAMLWLLGGALIAARTVRQWIAAGRLRGTDVSAADAHWQTTFEAVCRDMGVDRAVRLMQSGVAEVPMVIGWLRPVVLVPASAFTGVPPDQLRSILAHEIAHVRRHDYLVNGLQKVVEAALFFHPAVWWLSHRVRVERENCCDDEAVVFSGSALAYANALHQLETIRAEGVPVAVAVTGGSVIDRIMRIVGVNASRGCTLRSRMATAFAVAGIVLAIAGFTYAALGDPSAQDALAENRAAPAVVESRIQAALESGDITQKEADAIREGSSKREKGVTKEDSTKDIAFDDKKLTPELWGDEKKADWNAGVDAKVAGLAEIGITVETTEIAPGVRDIVWSEELKAALGDFDKDDVEVKNVKEVGR